MKKVCVIVLLSMIFFLTSCSSNQHNYKDLVNAINQMVEEKNNDLFSSEDKTKYLSAYIDQSATDYPYEISKSLTYSDETLFEAIQFDIIFFGDGTEFDSDDVNKSLAYFQTMVEDFHRMNDNIYYQFSIDYQSFEVMELTYTNDMLFKKLTLNIETLDSIDLLYAQYEDLIIELSNNDYLDAIDILINGIDYSINLYLKLNLGYFAYSFGQLDSNSSNTFEDIINFINNSMKETDLIPIESYQTN